MNGQQNDYFGVEGGNASGPILVIAMFLASFHALLKPIVVLCALITWVNSSYVADIIVHFLYSRDMLVCFWQPYQATIRCIGNFSAGYVIFAEIENISIQKHTATKLKQNCFYQVKYSNVPTAPEPLLKSFLVKKLLLLKKETF